MATSISNGESGLSVRTKLNDIWHSLDLNEYNKEILDTAVDVFVYDTSKDSDGGAWRKRTQGTSWYNETLNTSTRGSRKEFPAVAVIVAEAAQVTIYDGDDPDLPMWMVFNSSTTKALYSDTISSVAMLNGTLVVGSNGASGAVSAALFLEDNFWFKTSAGGHYSISLTIAKRETSWSAAFTTTAVFIVNRIVNDVAMTVLPNAPIDAATGLPVPTIAVATDGGVSVIKDDGTVVDITWSSEGVVGRIAFIGDKIRIGGSSASTAQYAARMYEIPSSDISLGAMYVNDATAVNVYLASSMHGTNIFSADMFYNGTTSNKSFYVKDAIASSTKGLTHLSENYEDATKAMMAYATSTYNTGWMNGDIKLATLSDTDATNVTGAELVTNGTFDSNISGWTASDAGCSLSLVSNQLRITNNDATAGGAVTSFSVVSGKVYTFNVGTSSKDVWLYLGNVPNTGTYFGAIVSNSHTWTSTVTGTVYFMIKNSVTTNGDTVDIDNVSVRLAEEDRSVNNNGLQVFGTLTKAPVATGAELVAYSGFSTSNYLVQPYNSDLDFGTGDFCIMGWFKRTATSGNILDRGNGSDNTDRIQVHVFSGSQFRVVLDGTALATSAIPSGVWTHLTYARRSGVGYLYLNSNLETSGAQAGDVSNTYETKIGISQTLGDPCPGDLALLRISATAPSPEAIKRIYEDEKVLFQENAKAVLYGTSDAVTALAFDDTTNLLHVGTSAGRSVFQGLRRVDNTTDAITAAISASNGLVAEE